MPLTHITWHGFDAIQLENNTVRVVIVPELGAKIASLYDKQAEREWLLEPVRPVRRAPYGAVLIEYDVAGWDEMFPTIVPDTYPVEGPFHGRALPDHGEVWTLPWTRDDAAPDTLQLSVEGQALPYRLTRAAVLDEPGTLRLTYTVANLGAAPLAYLYTAHPLFAVDTATEIVLPSHITEVYNVLEWADWGPHGERYGWPRATDRAGKAWQIDRLPTVDSKDFRKFYAPPEARVDWAALRQTDTGAWLRLHWNADELPYLGLWIDEGAYGSGATVALEPSNAFYDGLTIAYNQNRYGTLPPHATQSWRITVRVDPGSAPIQP